MTDITDGFQLANERKTLERKLQEASHLSSLGLMVGCVTHDFNNIMLPILLNAELALKSIEPSHAAGDFLREIISSVKCASELTKQLLNFGGAETSIKEVVDLNELVAAITELSRVAAGRNAELKLSLDKIPLLIQANTTQLRQLLVNLLTNAAEAAVDEHLQITIETSSLIVTGPIPTQRVFASKAVNGNYAVLTVHDNGCGMSPELLERIFQPFYSTKGSGRGLGLTAVQGIVTDHCGFMTVDSTPNKGTSFRIGFPIVGTGQRSCMSDDALLLADEVNPFQQLRILVVDDSPRSLQSLTSVCSRLGHFVSVATSDVVASAAIETGKFDLVLIDAEMPDECCDRLLGSISESVEAAVVLMSAERKLATLQAVPRVHSVLMKPFSTADLVAIFNRIRPQGKSGQSSGKAATTR